MAQHSMELRRRRFLRDVPTVSAAPSTPPEPESDGAESERSSELSEPPASPPSFVVDQNPGEEQQVQNYLDIDKLHEDLQVGEFTTLPIIPQDLPPPYQTPSWLPQLVQYLLDLTPKESRQDNSGLKTSHITTDFVYTQPQLSLLEVKDDSTVLPTFIQSLFNMDLTSAGNLLRLIHPIPADPLSPACNAAYSLHPVPITSNFRDSQYGYQEVLSLAECLASEPKSLFPIPPCLPGELCDQLLQSKGLPPSTKVYSVYIVESGLPQITTAVADAPLTPETYFSQNFGPERQILTDVADTQRGFGKAYLHFTRYRILTSIAFTTGVNLYAPSHLVLVSLPSGTSVTLNRESLFHWAGVSSGTFGNRRPLMVKADQRFTALNSLLTPLEPNDEILLQNLKQLAADPAEYPPHSRLPPALQWSLVDLNTRLDPVLNPAARAGRGQRGRTRRCTPQDSLDACLQKTTACDLTLRIHAEDGHAWAHSLARSQGRKNGVRIATFNEFLTVLLPLLQQDLGRVRHLNVMANNQGEALTTLEAIGRFGVGNVQQLRVYNGKYGYGEGPGGSVTIPPMPHLQQLVLGKIDPLCLGAPVFSRLTGLRLGDIRGENPPPGPFVLPHAAGRTLAALAAASQLVILHLDGVWDGIIPLHPRVLLPRLEDFWFSCRDDETLSLAAALEIPHLQRFRVEIKDKNTTALLTRTCKHLLSQPTWVELRLDDNDPAVYRDFCACTTNVECLDLRGCHENAAEAFIYLARAGRLPCQLTHLRMSCPVMRSQLADILIEAPQIVCLTSGQEVPCREPNRRW
ncbi:hypothetical protein C8R43DRAFT_1116987 [Mycena crocata]|nr:hypothetical protein C8R43DRAFT_1116987 [Mycena crocata]